MSNLVAALAEYLETPATPQGLVAAFAGGKHTDEQLIAELVREAHLSAGASDKDRRKARSTALRQLQRWEIRGGKLGKQTRSVAGMKPETQKKLRRILIKRKTPAEITARGYIGYNERDKRPRIITVHNWTYRRLRDLQRIAAVAEKHQLEWEHDGEETATFVFNGYYFPGVRPEPLLPPPLPTVAYAPYDETLDYSEATFTIRPTPRAVPVKPGRRVSRKIKKEG